MIRVAPLLRSARDAEIASPDRALPLSLALFEPRGRAGDVAFAQGVAVSSFAVPASALRAAKH